MFIRKLTGAAQVLSHVDLAYIVIQTTSRFKCSCGMEMWLRQIVRSMDWKGCYHRGHLAHVDMQPIALRGSMFVAPRQRLDFVRIEDDYVIMSHRS